MLQSNVLKERKKLYYQIEKNKYAQFVRDYEKKPANTYVVNKEKLKNFIIDNDMKVKKPERIAGYKVYEITDDKNNRLGLLYKNKNQQITHWIIK